MIAELRAALPALTGVLADPAAQAHFERCGYAVVPWLDGAQTQALLELWERHDDPLKDTGFSTTLRSPDAAARRRLGDAVCDAFAAAARRNMPAMRPCFGAFAAKRAGDPQSALGWHQDPSYLDEFALPEVNVWVPLVDLDESNGTLNVVPGSHLLNRYPRGFNRRVFPYPGLEDPLWRFFAMPLRLRRGQAVVLHHMLFHASPPNRSERPRVAAIAMMVPRDARIHFYHESYERSQIDVYPVADEYFYSQPDAIIGFPSGQPSLGFYELLCEPVDLDRVARTVAGALERGSGAAECALVHDRLLEALRAAVPPAPVAAPAECSWEGVAAAAFATLRGHAASHFAEALHSLPFPREQGFAGPRERHHGDIFARALILDALCDARDAGYDAGDVIARERDYLLAMRRSHGAGGWAYFPTLRELPADADDLAAVWTALSRAGADPHAHAADALRMWRESLRDDGSFETWIADESGAAQMQEPWIEGAWGRGYDVDVAARCAHALGGELSEPARTRLLARIAAEQLPSGEWPGSWYCGPFYPTLLALRAFARYGEHPERIARAAAYLRSSQRADGGWGTGDGSDALSTAQAAWALCLGPHAPETERSLRRALAWLHAWCRSPLAADLPFIRMELGRAQGRVHTTLTYGSACITYATLLQAAIACSHARSNPEDP